VGYALYLAQNGNKHPKAKPLSGFGGAGVLEVVDDFDGDTYRAVYTVRFAESIYVLHTFQKKSRSGIATPPQEIATVRARLKTVEMLHRDWLAQEEPKMNDNTSIFVGSGNVFADLGLPNPELLLAKAKLIVQIQDFMDKHLLTLAQIAAQIGVTEEQVGRLLAGRLDDFTFDQLFQFLNRLGRRVEVRISAENYPPEEATLSVVAAY